MCENGKQNSDDKGNEMVLHDTNGRIDRGMDPEKNSEKAVKYPRHIFFIIVNEFCERFSYYGMKTVLPIFLKNKLRYSESESTIIYHSFSMINYFFPIIGAIIADSLLGRYKTIFYLSIVYALGNMTLAASSAILLWNIPHRTTALLGLFLIALGSGGIKPCVSSFGGDQFMVPQQEMQLQQFFSIFYFSINVGSMFGTLISPILRQDVHCLGEESCFPLAFALPAFLMVVAIVIFVLGKRFYLIRKPGGNVLIRMCGCIGYALKKRVTCDTRGQKTNHWLELANDKYDAKLINETRIMLSLALMLTPCVFFWALFEQTGSRWTFQASRMNGEVMNGNFEIKPDQLHIINPILVLCIIPFFQKVLYPCLDRLHLLRTQLQKMVLGGILTAVAFFMSGILEMYLQPTYAVLPGPGEAQLRIFNSFDCKVHLHGGKEFNSSVILEPHAMIEMKLADISLEKVINVNAKMLREECPNLDSSLEWEGVFKVTEKKATSYLIHGNSRDLNVTSTGYDNLAKSDNGNPRIRIFYSTTENSILTIRGLEKKNKEVKRDFKLNSANVTGEELELQSGRYELSYNKISTKIVLEFGGVYRIMIPNNIASEKNKNSIQLFTITPPSSISMLWMVPQFFVITVAEVLFSVTALEFSFMQAPTSMKSVASSLNLLSTSLGNFVVVFIEKAVHTNNQVHNFFIYGGLMIFVMVIFTILAMNYKYVDHSSKDSDDEPNYQDNPAFDMGDRETVINNKNSGM
ncbi:peptide transporter family 1 [Nilaparvata lugens]|uniref:peptide transporter family 1 n=1 Tax=Nilaparvata lugens TaxID=108931 RepID=UPI00193E6035|nr:peptide transporter family 1 [Nilaparvata lugens]